MMGSKKNYHSLAKHKAISGENDAYLLDLRNHGDSPHVESMDINSMADDIIHFMDLNNIEYANVLGHSLGGRVLMEASLKYPERVKNQIIVDIGPFDYLDRKQFPYTESTRIMLEKLNRINL